MTASNIIKEANRHCHALAFLVFVIQLAIWLRPGCLQKEKQGRLYETKQEYAYEISVTQNIRVGDGDPCTGHKSCSECVMSRFQSAVALNELSSKPECHWCPLSSVCYSPSNQPKSFCTDRRVKVSKDITYQYHCPLGPIPYPDNPPTFLPDWMGSFYKANMLSHSRLIDLSLPGTHDSLSYDLSLTVSEDGIDSLHKLAAFLHKISGGKVKILPGDLEEFFRMQGKTQQLSLTEQLDNGIRFLDFRIMYEPDKKKWFSMHFMQSQQPAEQYLQQIRDWLDKHPHEVIVIWLSKHGSTSATGTHQYPGVSPSEKQQFWQKYVRIFDGLLMNTTESSIFETSMADLITRNHRVVSFVSDYAEFSNSSLLAMNAAKIQNVFDDGDGVFKEESLLQRHIDYFKNASVNNAAINKGGGFTLLAMNTAGTGWQLLEAAKQQFLHWLSEGDFDVRSVTEDELATLQNLFNLNQTSPAWASIQSTDLNNVRISDIFPSCHGHIKIPGVDHWCPPDLMDIGQLSSYYNQIAIDLAYQHSNFVRSDERETGSSKRVVAAFPNAFYLDVLDYDGSLRIGPQLLDGTERGDMSNRQTLPTKDARFAYVDTVLAYNAELACQAQDLSSGCEDVLSQIYRRRARYPMQRWDEPDLGRHTDWPPYSYDNPLPVKVEQQRPADTEFVTPG